MLGVKWSDRYQQKENMMKSIGPHNNALKDVRAKAQHRGSNHKEGCGRSRELELDRLYTKMY
jgi:hypothetical protein